MFNVMRAVDRLAAEGGNFHTNPTKLKSTFIFCSMAFESVY